MAKIVIDGGGSGRLTVGDGILRRGWRMKMAGIQWRRRHSMAATMADCEALTRRRGQRGRSRHNNQIEAAAGNGGQRRQHVAMATGVSSSGSGSGTCGGSGGRRLRW